MSVEQWAVLALFVLLPLLEAVARRRRAHATRDEALDHAGDVPAASPPSHPPRLPEAVPPPVRSRSRRSASRTSDQAPGSIQAHTANGKAIAGDPVVQWLRPVRNLRHAIIVATILGPPRDGEF